MYLNGRYNNWIPPKTGEVVAVELVADGKIIDHHGAAALASATGNAVNAARDDRLHLRKPTIPQQVGYRLRRLREDTAGSAWPNRWLNQCLCVGSF
ncbi:hypothetical protein ACLKA6_009777 [Drosophila palustris]